MQAIILAAGYGRRMQPLSDGSHKALLPVAGVTILDRIVESLLEIDVADIIVVTGYRADDVTAHLTQRYPELRFTFVHNARYAETNNIVSLSMALDRTAPDQDVVLIECDLIYERSLLRRLTGPARGNVALVDRYRAGMDGTVVAVDDGVITHVFPPHLQGPEFSFSDKYKTLNIYRFDAAFCRATLQPLLNCYANLIDGNCYYELVLGMLVNMQRHRIAAEVVDGSSWAEVDDPNDLAVARASSSTVSIAPTSSTARSADTGASTSSTSRSCATPTSRPTRWSRRCGRRSRTSCATTAPRRSCSTRSSATSSAARRSACMR